MWAYIQPGFEKWNADLVTFGSAYEVKIGLGGQACQWPQPRGRKKTMGAPMPIDRD
jgi:hypothetical protein